MTALLSAARAGDDSARERLWTAVERELRAMAGSLLRREPSESTLGATALVSEAYLRLAGGDAIDAADRRYFFGAAARAMSRIVIEHARRRRRRSSAPVRLDGAPETWPREDLVALEAALDALAEQAPRAAEVVRLRFWCGLTIEQVAVVLEVAPMTVKRAWRSGRAWLHDQVVPAEPGSGS